MSRAMSLRLGLSITLLTLLLVVALVLVAGAAAASPSQPPTPGAAPPMLASLLAQPHAPQPASGVVRQSAPPRQPPTAAIDDPAPASEVLDPGALVRPWEQRPAIAPLSGAARTASAAVAIAATQAITVYVTSHWVEGYTTANADIEILITQTGAAVGLSRLRSDNTGYFAVDTMALSGRHLELQAGMVLTVKANTTTVATIAIPGPTTGAVDPAANRVTGIVVGAPLPATLLVSTAGVSQQVTTDATGAYTAAFAGIADLVWWDGATVAWKDANGNWIAWVFYPRGGIVTIPTYDEVDGCTEPGQTVTIAVTHDGATTTRTAAGSTGSGCWWVAFPAIDAGDTVVANFGASTVTQTVSNLAGATDVAADRVSITASPPNAAVSIAYRQYQGLISDNLWQFGTTDGSGTWTAQFPAGSINRYSWPAIIYADGAASDTYQLVPVPWVVGYWNGNRTWGYSAADVPVTATLLRDGSAIETRTGQTDAAHGYFNLTFQTRFALNDQVRIQAAPIDQVITLISMALDLDRASDGLILYGPANSRYLAFLYRMDFARNWRGWVQQTNSTTTVVPMSETLDFHNGSYGLIYRPENANPDDLAWTMKYGYAPRFVVNERYNAFFGEITRADFDFDVTAKRGATIVGAGSGRSETWHSAPWTYFHDGGGQEVDVLPGDTVQIHWGTQTESMEVLGLTGRVDTATEKVIGTWLPNRFVRVREQNNYTGLFVPTDATGKFVADFTGLADLRGGMQVDISAWTTAWDRTEIIVQIPYARANSTFDTVSGPFEAGEVVSWVVKAAGGAVKGSGSGTTPEWGWFDQQCDCNMVPGDTVEVTSDRGFAATLQLVPITARVDIDWNSVSGEITAAGLPGEANVWTWSNVRDDGRGMDVPVAADGAYTADFSGDWDVRLGDDGEVWLYDANRNQVGLHWWAGGKMDVFYTDDSFWVDGTPAAPFTVTVQGKATFHGQINPRGYYATWEDSTYAWDPAQPDIEPGDVVILEQDGFTKRLDPFLDIPMNIDRNADTVSGVIAGPGRDRITQVSCSARYPDGGLQASYNGTTGVYFCDFKAAGLDLTSRTDLEVRYRDPDGDVAVNQKDGQWARANITWDSVGGVYGEGVQMNFIVNSSGGALKASGSAVGKRDGWVNDVWVGDQADLIPGDRVHVWTNNGFDAWLTLVDITGRIDVGTNTISGKITGVSRPASGWIGFNRPATDEWIGQSWESGADGSFVIDMNPYDVRVGDESEVWYSDANGNAPGAWFPTLRGEVNTGGDWVVLYTGAAQPFTVIVQSATGQTKGTLTGVTDRNGNMRGWEEQWYDKWIPAQPDIVPGDRVSFTAYGYSKQIDPVADISWQADVVNDRITGRIVAPGQTEPVRTWCSIWSGGDAGVDAAPPRVDPNGGTFTCDFRAVGWDLQPGQYAAVGFRNSNSDDTYNSFGVTSRTYLPLLRR